MKKWILFIIAIIALLFCAPVLFLLSGSLMDPGELSDHIGSVINGNGGDFAEWPLLPREPSLRSVVALLFDRPEFFVMFWNTMLIAFGTIAGQFVFAVTGAWGFARYEFAAKKFLFSVYIVLMLLPFQVLMLPEYMVLDRLALLDTPWAVILPGVFSTFPVFIMYNFFRKIPGPVIDAARLDGANEWKVFLKVGVPLGKTGIIATLMLCFFECWALIEQPMVFIKNKMLWPLSLYLPNIRMENAGQAFAAAVLSLILPVLIFMLGQEYLEKGVAATAVKE
jgi:multiple sugar transport system permease protein